MEGKTKITKTQIWILLFTIAYVIGFGIYYLTIQNYEFLIYVAILVFLIWFVGWLHTRYNFPTGVLLGASIWGLMHMAGGSIYINGTKLYGLILVPLFSSSVAGTDIFRYDQLAHIYCYIVVTILLFYILKVYIDGKKVNKFAISVLLVLMGMGVGALNEIIEFIPVLILKETGVGDYFNTLWDIISNTLGAIIAVVYLNLSGKINLKV